jgi:hypothetical protein
VNEAPIIIQRFDTYLLVIIYSVCQRDRSALLKRTTSAHHPETTIGEF